MSDSYNLIILITSLFAPPIRILLIHFVAYTILDLMKFGRCHRASIPFRQHVPNKVVNLIKEHHIQRFTIYFTIGCIMGWFSIRFTVALPHCRCFACEYHAAVHPNFGFYISAVPCHHRTAAIRFVFPSHTTTLAQVGSVFRLQLAVKRSSTCSFKDFNHSSRG